MYKLQKFSIVIAAALCVTLSHAKYYDTKCNLIQDILEISNLSVEEAAKWACVGRLSTHVDSGGFIGVFQIGSEWWCSPSGGGNCNVNCSFLMDEDIRDDFECAQKIYKGFGNSFDAWPGSDYCLNNQAGSFAKDCVVHRRPQVTKQPPVVVRGPKHRELEANDKNFIDHSQEHEDEHPEDDFP